MEYTIRSDRGLRLGKFISQDNGADVRLKPEELFELNGDQRNTKITCLDGTLWITQTGDFEDHFIQKGDSFQVTELGRILVQGMPEGKARVLPFSFSVN